MCHTFLNTSNDSDFDLTSHINLGDHTFAPDQTNMHHLAHNTYQSHFTHLLFIYSIIRYYSRLARPRFMQISTTSLVDINSNNKYSTNWLKFSSLYTLIVRRIGHVHPIVVCDPTESTPVATYRHDDQQPFIIQAIIIISSDVHGKTDRFVFYVSSLLLLLLNS